MKYCRVCSTPIEKFMTFGKMPIANGFLTKDQIKNEYFFELAPAFCSKCEMFQIVDQPDPQMMFHENYAFFSSTSVNMQKHFKEFSDSVSETYLAGRSDPFVVEIGSNDGIMLRNFQQMGIRHLGVEPSQNVAEIARSKNINTVSEFFSTELADKIEAEYGKADVILSANVICHIPDINSVAAGIRKLLKPQGVFVYEDPYLGSMVEKTSYDQIYDEHVFIFSARSVANAFGRHGLELIDVKPQKTHGGSMRYYIALKGQYMPNPSVSALIAKEQAQGLDKPQTYLKFRDNCERSKENLLLMLKKAKAEGKRVVGYAATSKSTTVMNYCGIDTSLIEFISDTTPIKQGKLSPGTHIPVKAYDEFQKNYPDYALLFAWNHSEEIFAKETAFRNQGGKWIVFVPEVGIV